MQPDGRFGPDGTRIKTLLTYYHVRRDARALDAAKAEGRFIANNDRLTKLFGSATAIRPLLNLADASGEAVFVDLALKIAEVEQLRMLEQPKEGTHGITACMVPDAYASLYERTGNRRYLDWALQGWQAVP